jgi:hypothetical protein
MDCCRNSLLTGEAMIIYLIGSLRNPLIPDYGNALRKAGHDVYDDWFAGGREADDEWQRYEGVRSRSYQEALNGYHANCVFSQDLFHLNRSHGVVLALPAGKSGHLEFGHSRGQGKPGWLLVDQDEPDRYDVMNRFATGICRSLESLVGEIKKYPWAPAASIPSIHASDAFWLAGLLEGEGSFTCDVIRGSYLRPRIALQMTDKDTVVRVAKLMGSSVWGPYKKTSPRKDVWACAVTGGKAGEWMRILKPYLGSRRRSKVEEILNAWTPRPYYSRSKNNELGSIPSPVPVRVREDGYVGEVVRLPAPGEWR